MPKLHIGTNLKMYKTIRETVSYLSELQNLTSDLSGEICLFVIPSYTSLPAASAMIDRRWMKLGAQNMHWEEEGPFTGEISSLMLQELNVEIVEIGHSERRQMFRETDVEENKKVLSALSHGLIPLLCVGETAEEKRLGIEEERLKDQLKTGLQNAREVDCAKLWIAYEPVWAIGADGVPADADYANQKQQVIRDILRELFPREGDKVIILYGGSVNPDNAESLISQPAIDGLFIGRAAWEAAMFNSLVRKILPLWRRKRNREEIGAFLHEPFGKG